MAVNLRTDFVVSHFTNSSVGMFEMDLATNVEGGDYVERGYSISLSPMLLPLQLRSEFTPRN